MTFCSLAWILRYLSCLGFSEIPESVVWWLSLILESSQPLLQILHSSLLSFSFFRPSQSNLYHIFYDGLTVIGCSVFFYSFIFFFSLCLRRVISFQSGFSFCAFLLCKVRSLTSKQLEASLGPLLPFPRRHPLCLGDIFFSQWTALMLLLKKSVDPVLVSLLLDSVLLIYLPILILTTYLL